MDPLHPAEPVERSEDGLLLEARLTDNGLSIKMFHDRGHLPMSWVQFWREKGYIQLVNERHVTRPGGPPDDPWKGALIGNGERANHQFVQADQIIINTTDGDLVLNVTRQPDKYADSHDDDSVTDEVYALGQTNVGYFFGIEEGYLMADQVFNRGLGRVTELCERVNANDPTNSVLTINAWNSSATDATIKDLDTVAQLESDGNTAEATNSGYARKVLDQAASIVITYDDTNNRVDIDFPDPTWTAVQTAPGAWTDLSVNYDSDSTGGADSAIVPLTWHDFAVTPDGSDITAQLAATGFYRAA